MRVQQVGVDGEEPPQVVFELVLELLVALGLFRLTFDLAKGPLDLADDVLEAEQILPGVLELELRLVLACFVACDPSGFLEQCAAVNRARREDLADAALLDDRVCAGAETYFRKLVEDVLQTDRSSVEPVLRRARSEDPTSDFESAVGFLPVAVVGLEDQSHFCRSCRLSRGGSGEDHVSHLLEPHQRSSLLSENPENGVDKVRFAAAVWTDDCRHLPRKGQFDLVREGFEAVELQRAQTDARHCGRNGSRTGRPMVAIAVTSC